MDGFFKVLVFGDVDSIRKLISDNMYYKYDFSNNVTYRLSFVKYTIQSLVVKTINVRDVE